MRGKQVPKICTAFVSLALLAVLWAPRASAQSSTGNNFAVSGNGPQQNLFLLNGVEYTGAAENNMQPGGTSQQLLGGDAVREFNVLRDTYSAEYGKHPGRQVVIVTQSGSNQLHGNVFEFLRNNDLDSPNFFDQGSAPSFSAESVWRIAGRADPGGQDLKSARRGVGCRDGAQHAAPLQWALKWVRRLGRGRGRRCLGGRCRLGSSRRDRGLRR
jgi:hypothetical protein